MQYSESPLSILQETEQAYAKASQGMLSIIDLFNVTQRLTEAKHPDIAIQLYRLWLERTDSPVAYAVQFNMAVLLSNDNDGQGAETAYREAIAKKPTFVEGHLNLGTLLERKGHPEEAITVWRKVLGFVNVEFPADCAFYVQALNNLGRLLEIQKQLPEAEAMLTLSLKQDSKQAPSITHWVHIRQKLCEWPIYSDALGIPKKDMLDGTSALAILSASDDPALQLATAKRYINEKVLKDVNYLSSKQSYGHERLRIAYLSSDFCSHAISILTAELYGLHDRSKFEVFGFCWSHEDGSPLRARVIAGMDHHIKIGMLSDEAAAQLIRSHEIDILIDLNGLTLGTRHDILSYRPAPVQITWLGFPGSTALPEIDYVLCDSFVFPPELEPFFTEKPLRMPHTFQVNDRLRSISSCPTRESCGLPKQAFVFCSFNNTYKITPDVFNVWMRILKRVPNSILWLVADNETVRNNLYKHAKSQGIASNRLHFADRALPADYLARFQIADLFLDTFPFGGGTTASDALWAGLPLLTYSGKTFASRMAGSLLTAVDLPKLITFNLKDYEDKAVKLAQHPEQIAAMKKKLVDNRMSCALFDTPRFVRDFETLCIKVINELTDATKENKRYQVAEFTRAYQAIKKLRFLIASPRYDHQIGGVMVLHQLCDMLNRQGYEAAMVFYGGSPPSYNWAYSNHPDLYHPDYERVHLSMDNPNEIIREFLQDGVIIYPEQIIGNPLGASRVVKYILITDKNYIRASSNEYILSFSKIFHSKADGYLFKPFMDENLHSKGSRHWSERTMDLTYFGKGPDFVDCFKIPNTLVLTRKWPEDKNQLGILLRQCRYFFTWDLISQTNMDAVACGAVPVLLHDKQISKDLLNMSELGRFPDIKLTDLHDKESFSGDAIEIDLYLDEMNNKSIQYMNSWPERVKQFAVDVTHFFNSVIE